NGRGGLFAPDLSTVGARRDARWLAEHFRDPQAVSPHSLMPRLNLLPDETDQLVAFMGTLGGSGPFTEEAPKLFAEHCGACHNLDGQGGDTGPELTTIRTYRDKGTVYTYIRDPASMNPGSIMPGFQSVLTDAQIEDLSRYLMSSQRNPK
ncbi:MAG: cbb3-type cytochrome c oxidase subunit II, partial [Deltaproteobacteria bacterium]|nr:cbb3-type cytochrome c oxidase subunit II [Deltaproteobacteria bacterium]